MAIKITNSVITFEGGDIEISYAYIRLFAEMHFDGNRISIYPRVYTSKNSYLNNINSNISVKRLNHHYDFVYDYNPDNLDLLLNIHQEFIKQISTSITSVEVETDEEGNIIYDADGNIVYKTVLIQDAFCKAENCEIVDLSLEKEIVE